MTASPYAPAAGVCAHNIAARQRARDIAAATAAFAPHPAEERPQAASRRTPEPDDPGLRVSAGFVADVARAHQRRGRMEGALAGFCASAAAAAVALFVWGCP